MIRFNFVKIIFLISLSYCFFIYSLSAQTKIKYYNDIDFVAAKIKEVYAGFKDKVSEKKFADLVEKVKQSTSNDTFRLLSELTLYFKDRHLIIGDKEIKKDVDSLECSNNLTNILAYLNNDKIEKDSIEGFWRSDINDCIIGIKKTSTIPLTYKGYVVESKNKIINGFRNLVLEKSVSGEFISDYKDITWIFRIFTPVFFKTSNSFTIGPYRKWIKIENYKQGILDDFLEFNFSPSVKVIDSNNVLVTISDFGGKNYLIIDSLVKANLDKISKAKNLIIDIRNNAGGFTDCYLPFIPYMCTNDIIHDASLTLCSDEIISSREELVKSNYKKGDTIKAKEYEQRVIKMKNRRGDFLLSEGDTLKCTSISKSPENIAIITNYACMSAAELMLFDFKQSTKVKIFGERTAGAVDYLNFRKITLPSGKFSFRVATVKRITNEVRPKYDNVGIQPDIEIPERVTDWVDFVKSYYEKN